jgi:aspartate kinase
MKVMKFGGTSVGRPDRMHQVADLITGDSEAKIVVLSALSGTTNALVEISNSLASGNRNEAKNQIDALEKHYLEFIAKLVTTDATLHKARAIVTEHFEFLNIILRISFSDALNKDILAQGELLSTKLFCIYLEEKGIDHAYLPALEFMMIDSYDEPQIGSIRVKLNQQLAKQLCEVFEALLGPKTMQLHQGRRGIV